MDTVGILAAALGLLISVAGIVYPFKPFKTRMRALGAAAACFFILGVLAQPSGDNVAQSPEKGWWNEQDNGVVESTPHSTAIAQAESEAEVASGPQRPSEADLRKVWSQFDTQKWSQVVYQIMVFRKKGYEIEDLVLKLEQDTLSIVKPLPASDVNGNLAGYELLTVLRPDNALYGKKVSDYKAKEKQARQAAISRLRVKEDRVEGITWYQHPNKPKYLNSRSTVYLYIGRKGKLGSPTLRMKTVYAASDWLFVNNVIAWHDGVKETFVSGYFERDNHSRVWEWRDDIPSEYQIRILQSLASAKEAILRFEGDQYRKDVKLSEGDKRAIREVLLAYEVMKSGR